MAKQSQSMPGRNPRSASKPTQAAHAGAVRAKPQGRRAQEASPVCQIPLDLDPAIPERRNSQRVAIKIEGLLSGARLSRGQNNGDHTWSLNLDELENLFYMPAEPAFEPHTLAVRVLDFDDGFANTLDLFDLEITPVETLPELLEESADETDDLLILTDETAEDEDSAARDALLRAGAAQQIAALRTELQAEADAKMEAAKVAWEKQTEKRVAEVKAAAARDIEAAYGEVAGGSQERATLQAQSQALRDEADKARKLAVALGEEVEAARGRIHSLEQDLASAASRAATAEGAAEKTGAALAEATSRAERAEAAASDSRAAATNALQEEMQALRNDLVSSQAALEAHGREAEFAQRELKDALATEHGKQVAAIRAEHEERLLASQRQAEEKLALLCQDHESALNEERAENRRRIDAMTAAHEQSLSQFNADAESRLAQEVDTRLAKARAKWAREVEEAVQKTVADAKEAAVGEARKQWESERHAVSSQAADARRKEEEQRLDAARAVWEATQQGVLEERETFLKRDYDERLADARKSWQAEEEERLSDAKAAWEAGRQALQAEREESARVEIERRVAQAKILWVEEEAQRLAQVKAEAQQAQQAQYAALAARDEQWHAEMEKQVAATRAACQAEEEQRLAAARAEWERSSPEGRREPAAKTEEPHRPVWIDGSEWELQDVRSPDPADKPPGALKATASSIAGAVGSAARLFQMRLFLRLGAVAAVIGGGVFAYPHVKPYVKPWFGYIEPLSSGISAKVESFGEKALRPGGPKKPAAEPAGGISLRASVANLRAGPSMESDVVGFVNRGDRIELIGNRGNWVRIRAHGKKVREGWIHNSLLTGKSG